MIVITGGAGFIGSVILWKLNLLGERNILIVDQDAKGSPKWANVKKATFQDYFESDIFLEKLERGEFDGKVKAIFHMGACSSTTEMDIDYLKRNNSGYSECIANWCLKTGAYLSYASSAAIYGDGELTFSDDDKLTPRLKPLNPYGQSKLDFDEWVLRNGHEKHFTGFRFFNVYGPNEYHKGSMRSMVHKGFQQIQAEGKLKLFKSYRPEYADGGQMRDFVYVKDVVDALLWFYDRPELKGIYNLGRGKAQSWNDMADALFKATHKPKRIEYIEMPDSLKNQYQYFTEADLTKLRKAGYAAPFMDLEAGVADYVGNYLSKEDPTL
jgi:ADP-L-glycero-D-manno-heptose 6-epimerase